ncbi:hypothetical protein [Methylosinus sporium]|uniref:hypothetical protein n=1 Tax=Methylosinus sporium TaxID=428 RepID=UPI00383A83CC
MILIIAEETDMHALAVARALYEMKPSMQVTIVDAQEFPARSMIEIGTNYWSMKTLDGRVVSSSEVSSIWWRRALAHDISKSVRDPTARSFSANESAHAFRSIAHWPSYRVVNNVERERIASYKPLQHHIACNIGLKMPETIVTNDPKSVLDFYKEHKNIIYKVMTSPISMFAETRRFDESDLEALQSLTHAPVIFQKEITKTRDIRVTVVGKDVFTASVKGKLQRGKILPDWRLDATAECTQIDLPPDILSRILDLTGELGLDYAAVDLIEDVGGEIFFLEVNPSGQFLFVEIDTGQPISRSIAELLLRVGVS